MSLRGSNNVSTREEYRNKIDEIDRQLVKLMNERAKIVVEVGKIKRSRQDAPPIYAPDRERAVENGEELSLALG